MPSTDVIMSFPVLAISTFIFFPWNRCYRFCELVALPDLKPPEGHSNSCGQGIHGKTFIVRAPSWFTLLTSKGLTLRIIKFGTGTNAWLCVYRSSAGTLSAAVRIFRSSAGCLCLNIQTWCGTAFCLRRNF